MDIGTFRAATSQFQVGSENYTLRALKPDEINALGAEYPTDAGVILGLIIEKTADPANFVHFLLGMPFLSIVLRQARLLAASIAISIGDPSKRNEIMALPDIQLLIGFAAVIGLTLVDQGVVSPTNGKMSLADLATLDFSNVLAN